MKRESDEAYEPTLQVPFKKLKSGDRINLSIERGVNNSHVVGPLDPKFGQRRAFPVSIPLTGVDLDVVPKTVEQYLAQVRAEADLYGVNYGSEDENDSEDSENNDDLVYIAPPESDRELPTISDDQREIVQEFQSKKNQYHTFRSQLEELDAIELPQTQKEWKKFIWETSCEQEYIAQIIEEDQGGLLLVYFTKWLSMNPDLNLIEWIWGILTAFEPMGPSSISLIRNLGKKALKQSLVAPHEINLRKIIIIIALEFGQRDLLPQITTLSLPSSSLD